jgi:hypothetical protein
LPSAVAGLKSLAAISKQTMSSACREAASELMQGIVPAVIA